MKLKKRERKIIIKLMVNDLKVSEESAADLFNNLSARDKKFWIAKVK